MKHVFVLNPKSFSEKGKMDVIIDSLGQFFRRQERPVFSIHISHFPRDAIGIVRKDVLEAEGGPVRVYALGGDGILFDCLNGIMGLPNVELASVPYGNTNDFIRAFGEGKADLFKNIEAITTAPSIPTDVMTLGNNYAINSCTIGLESLAVIKMSKFSRQHSAFMAKMPFLYNPLFSFGGITSVFERGVMDQLYEVIIDDVDFSGHYSTINIANGPCYGGNKSAAPFARPDDGFLNVLLFRDIGPLATLMVMPGYVKGKTPSNCKIVRAKQIKISSDAPLQIQLDGEVFFDSDVTIEVKPAAVQFVAVNDLTYERKANNKK